MHRQLHAPLCQRLALARRADAHADRAAHGGARHGNVDPSHALGVGATLPRQLTTIGKLGVQLDLVALTGRHGAVFPVDQREPPRQPAHALGRTPGQPRRVVGLGRPDDEQGERHHQHGDEGQRVQEDPAHVEPGASQRRSAASSAEAETTARAPRLFQVPDVPGGSGLTGRRFFSCRGRLLLGSAPERHGGTHPSKKKKTTKRERKERRFEPQQTHTSWAAVAAGALGAAGLGAGVYAQWISDPAHTYAPYIVTSGALVLAGALWFGDSGAVPVRVGDAGIAIEKGKELVRLPWCDIERVSVDKGQLVVRGEDLTLTIPLGAHRAAVAWVLSEGVRRVPEVMDVKGSVVDTLPKPAEGDGEVLTIDAIQVAGRECAASGETIAFERDARLCPTCGQVYHKEHVPKRCVTCGESLPGRALRA